MTKMTKIKIDKLHVHVWSKKGDKIIKEIDAKRSGIYVDSPPEEGDYIQFGFVYEGKLFEIRAAVK